VCNTRAENSRVGRRSERAKPTLIVLDRSAGSLQVKMFGKIKIYLADQSKFPVPTEEELVEVDIPSAQQQKL
jgi:hypothetical protein